MTIEQYKPSKENSEILFNKVFSELEELSQKEKSIAVGEDVLTKVFNCFDLLKMVIKEKNLGISPDTRMLATTQLAFSIYKTGLIAARNCEDQTCIQLCSSGVVLSQQKIIELSSRNTQK